MQNKQKKNEKNTHVVYPWIRLCYGRVAYDDDDDSGSLWVEKCKIVCLISMQNFYRWNSYSHIFLLLQQAYAMVVSGDNAHVYGWTIAGWKNVIFVNIMTEL